ncbi:type VI secretion system protein TssA [Jiella sp. MQZ9-1]|uniref:Type VI secretion system protein TssA n=1 Tax=Jiella flava TaxID=2816857 RepID=A0A939G007_9HYPH|nr:type VI secretion system protein TssA [Jiella flava]MBO0662657.1 type VI secretion system protein TssA [Jiella flava]MCD2471079.1 type VI secretion system protein TssA [Jiella flava]
MVAIEIADLLQGLQDDNGCGENPRLGETSRSLYYSLKDARNAARADERATLPGDQIRVSASWQEVNRLATTILTEHGQDIEVLAWLAEAQLRLGGFDGLRDVFDVMEVLFRERWDQLHSIDDEELEDKVAPIAGLNGVGVEGSLIQPIRLAPLVPSGNFGQFSLWDYQMSQRAGETNRHDELMEAIAEAGSEVMARHHQIIVECAATCERISALLEERCGQDAPPTSKIVAAIKEVAAAVRVLAGIEATPEPVVGPAASARPRSANGHDDIPAAPTTDEASAPAASPPSEAAPQPSPATLPVSALVIKSRDEAFQVLAAVARYFRYAEPHSPIAASIDTMVRRGRMDFADLLSELLPDTGVRHQVLTAAGIQPPRPDGSGNPQ